MTVEAVETDLTDDEVIDLRDKIHNLIFTEDGGSLRLIGGLTRLAFHDCVGERCDGCINTAYEHNAGMSCLYALDENNFHQNLESSISLMANLLILHFSYDNQCSKFSLIAK